MLVGRTHGRSRSAGIRLDEEWERTFSYTILTLSMLEGHVYGIDNKATMTDDSDLPQSQHNGYTTSTR